MKQFRCFFETLLLNLLLDYLEWFAERTSRLVRVVGEIIVYTGKTEKTNYNK